MTALGDHNAMQQPRRAAPNRAQAGYLRGYGFTPDVVADVGVHSGTPQLYRAFPDCKFVLIDPRAEAEAETRARLAPRDYDFLACAAGAEDGELELRIPVTHKGTTAPAMAGFKPITGPMARIVRSHETRTVPVRPLDRILEPYPGCVGLKIDTEGFELEVLQGAAQTLRRCEFVILELSLIRRFDGVAAPSRIIAELARAGLELRDVLRRAGDGRGGPRPRLFDALFTRWEA